MHFNFSWMHGIGNFRTLYWYFRAGFTLETLITTSLFVSAATFDEFSCQALACKNEVNDLADFEINLSTRRMSGEW